MKLGRNIERVVDILTEILAFLTVALIVLVYVNRAVKGGVGFLPPDVAKVLESIREIAILLIVGLAGLQFALKRNFFIFLIYAILVAAAIILMFFPNVLLPLTSRFA